MTPGEPELHLVAPVRAARPRPRRPGQGAHTLRILLLAGDASMLRNRLYSGILRR